MALSPFAASSFSFAASRPPMCSVGSKCSGTSTPMYENPFSTVQFMMHVLVVSHLSESTVTPSIKVKHNAMRPGCYQSEDIMKTLHIEWCKSRAHTSQLAKEVKLLQEEMRRVAEFLSWHAAWWKEQAVRRTGLTTAEREGMQGYVRAMRDQFLALWNVVLVLLQLLSPVAP
ncbi:uncharacterized protein F5891DRAFT_982604 [Suillus fuscotomentosus]|uniref:Uncharacterized protein n=1 Tax=Suillus fuscotomentosus TaxID=1912939 RepID=A0AAD4E0C1_9AGAM|nr:uncharacterized protein F5891DRAFT_982604 [Suillus fuscotomentosus]KAG1897411.1 hypothetical protein F5891DRAFT_982604 [Suillus fuscotomentosus]